MGTRTESRIGQRFGRLTVLAVERSEKKKARFRCICDCGNPVTASCSHVVTGHTQSCGCLHRDRTSAAKNLGRNSCSAEYGCWANMLARCTNPKNRFYSYYGGRGIQVCERWLSLQNFYDDMGPRPSKKHSLDRIDNNGNYCKENCRWANRVEQARNTRAIMFLEYNGKRKPLIEWCEEAGVCRSTVRSRLRSGWSVEHALFTPPGNKRPVQEDDCGD